MEASCDSSSTPQPFCNLFWKEANAISHSTKKGPFIFREMSFELQFDPLWKVSASLSPKEIADWKAVPPGGRQGQCKQADVIS